MSFIESAVKNRGFASGLIQLPKDNFPVTVTVVLIAPYLPS